MIDKKTLSNGLNIVCYKQPNLHSIEIGLYIKMGSIYENEKNNGIAHLLEHLHFRQLGDMEQGELYYKTECMGTELRASTYKDMVRFYMKFCPQYFDECLNIFKDILTTYSWTKAQLEQEKRVVVNEIFDRESYDDIERMADEKIWKGHPASFQVLGNMESVENITVNDLVDYKRMFFSKGRVNLVITGNIQEDVFCKVEEVLQDVELSDSFIDETFACRGLFSRKPDIHFFDYPYDYVDVQLAFDVDGNKVSKHEVMFLNSIIGQGYGSLLSVKVREECGWTYDIHSSVNICSNLNLIKINYSTDKENVYESIETVLCLLNGLKKEVPEKQYNTNIKFFTDTMWQVMDAPSEMNSILGDEVVCDEEPLTIEERIKINESITLDRLKEAATEIFVPKNLSVSILGKTWKFRKKDIKGIVDKSLV